MHKKTFFVICILAMVSLLAGCAGYTTKTSLPSGIKTIYVPTIKNKIILEDMNIYVPGMEVDITNAIINRFNEDGTVKVVSRKEDADAILYITLKNFDQEGARFTNLESVEEYRIFITTDVLLLKPKPDGTNDEILNERNFTGKWSYFKKSSTEAQRMENQADARVPLMTTLPVATQDAIRNYAHNVVDLVTEDW